MVEQDELARRFQPFGSVGSVQFAVPKCFAPRRGESDDVPEPRGFAYVELEPKDASALHKCLSLVRVLVVRPCAHGVHAGTCSRRGGMCCASVWHTLRSGHHTEAADIPLRGWNVALLALTRARVLVCRSACVYLPVHLCACLRAHACAYMCVCACACVHVPFAACTRDDDARTDGAATRSQTHLCSTTTASGRGVCFA